MRRSPGIGVVGPRIRPGADRAKAIPAFGVGYATADAAEIGIERCQIAVHIVAIAPARIGLPDFNQRIRHGGTELIDHAAENLDTLADRQAVGGCVLAIIEQQIVVVTAQRHGTEIRARALRYTGRLDTHQCLLRRPQNRGLVARGRRIGMPVAIPHHERGVIVEGHNNLLCVPTMADPCRYVSNMPGGTSRAN
jgi:hypothetical protein